MNYCLGCQSGEKLQGTVMRLQPTIQLLIGSVGIASFGIIGCAQERKEVKAQEPIPITIASAEADVKALVRLGPRVAGTPVMDKARTYLIEAYRRAGYEAKIQTFTYSKFEDLGSSLTIAGQQIAAQALNGSVAGRPTAPLVAVPNVGRAADFATVNVKGAIALVRRGEIRFLEKAQNAAAAGAVGLIVVNTEPGNVSGTLGGAVNIPVLALAGQQGNPLLDKAQPGQQRATLVVNTRQRSVKGRNVVAHRPGVTQPKVLVGAHYDSVVGSPGANDNASGTAVVLAIARTAANTPLAHQAWFVAFDGEEDGLHGSRAFVRSAEPQFLRGLQAMMNFDMVGVNPQLRVGGTPSLTRLVRWAAPGVSIFGSHSGSDHASFASAGVPVLFFYRGQEPNYHSPQDRAVNPKLLNETTQAGLNIIQRLLTSDVNSASQTNRRL